MDTQLILVIFLLLVIGRFATAGAVCAPVCQCHYEDLADEDARQVRRIIILVNGTA